MQHESASQLLKPGPVEAAGRLAATFVLATCLLLVLALDLFGALVCALVTHAIYRRLIGWFATRLPRRSASAAALGLTFLMLALMGAAAWQAGTIVSAPRGGVPSLMQLLANMLDRLHGSLPGWLSERIPPSADDLVRIGGGWLRAHARWLEQWGHAAARTAAHVLVGVAIGLLAVFERKPRPASRWARACATSYRNLVRSFAVIVSAQVRIAMINAGLAAVYVLVVLPLVGAHVPFAGTLVAVTLIVGLLPIVGNLLSNTAIVLASLAAGPGVALASLVFLLAIHKLEYFLNAHLVGRATSVPAFCLLAAMLALEAGFGVAGLVAAPIYCAWMFCELRDNGLVTLDAPHERTAGACAGRQD